MGFPAARLTDMHTCPMCMGVPAPIVWKGAYTVLTGMLPQARVTDMCVCVGPPPPAGGDPIVTGAWNVLVEGLPAARMTDLTAKGGTIITGFPTVLIGMEGGGAEYSTQASVVAPDPQTFMSPSENSSNPFKNQKQKIQNTYTDASMSFLEKQIQNGVSPYLVNVYASVLGIGSVAIDLFFPEDATDLIPQKKILKAAKIARLDKIFAVLAKRKPSPITGADVRSLGQRVQGKFPTTKQKPHTVLYRETDGNITNYQVYDADGLPLKRVDLSGKTHGGVKTPHVQEYDKHIHPTTNEVFVRRLRTVRPAAPDEIP